MTQDLNDPAGDSSPTSTSVPANGRGRRGAQRAGRHDRGDGARRRPWLLAVLLGAVGALLVGGGVVAVRELTGPVPGNGSRGPAGTTPNLVGTGDGAASFQLGDEAPVDDWLAEAPQTRPAEYADSNYTWTAYPADSPEALALKFDPNARYAVATADGPDGYPVPTLFALTDNGWEAVETVEGDQTAIVGDTVYNVVTNDGGAEISYDLRAYDVAADTWSDIDLPAGAMAGVPPEATAIGVSSFLSIGSAGDSLLAAASSYYELDPLLMNGGENSDVSVEIGSDGSRRIVVTDFDCLDRLNLESANATEDEMEELVAECQEEVDPAQFGLNKVDVALAGTFSNTMWMLKDGTWQKLEMPTDGAVDASIHPGGIVEIFSESGASGEGSELVSRFYVADANGSFRPLYDGNSFAGGWGGGGYFGEAQTGLPVRAALNSSGPYLLRQDLTATEWSAADLNALGDGTGWGSYQVYPERIVETSDGGAVVLATVNTGLSTEPTELTSGDYTLRFEAGSTGSTVTNNATGEEVYEYAISTDSGQVRLIRWDENGNEQTLANFDTPWTDVPALASQDKTAVLASPDGVRFSTTDSDALMSLVGGGEKDDLVLNDAYTDNGQIVVSGTLVNIYGDGVGENFVFVGTPS